MKKNLQFAVIMICLSLLSFVNVNAQAPIASWEAESFVGIGFQVDGNNYPLVKSEEHSGGWYVQRISQSNSLLYYVNIETAGVYDLKMYYMVKAKGGQIGTTIGIRVNDQIIRGLTITEFTDTDDSTTPATATFPVYLDAGINKIRIGHNKKYIANIGYCPNFDKFELYTSIENLEKPVDDTAENINENLTPFREGADYTKLSGIFSIICESDPTNATVANLIDNDPTTEFVSSNVEETFIISYPGEKGIFCLRGIAAKNPHVIISPIERSNDIGETWDTGSGFRSHALYDLNQSVSYSTASIWRESDEPNPDTNFKNYTHYRITIQKPCWESQLKISDLMICGTFQNLVDLTEDENGTYSIEVINQRGTDGAGVINAFDNNFGSKCSFNADLFNITYTFNNYAEVKYYSVAIAGGGSGRDPKSWKLEGSNDNVTYVLLDTVADYTWANGKRAQILRKIENVGTYKYYKLSLTAKGSTTENYVHVSEFQLHGELKEKVTTGMGNYNIQPLNIFVKDNFIIFENTSTKNVNYQIFDVTGKQVKQGAFAKTQENVFLNNGLFVVRAFIDNEPISIKILIK